MKSFHVKNISGSTRSITTVTPSIMYKKKKWNILRKPDSGLSCREFYIRSFTWGLPVNVGGAACALAMLATGHKPDRFGQCVHFSVGEKWGGGSLGIFLFTCKDASRRLLEHEHGHSIQNCYYGPFMPFLVNLPSSSRYWYRRAVQRIFPEKILPPYDSIWFEAEASKLGHEYMNGKYPLR